MRNTSGRSCMEDDGLSTFVGKQSHAGADEHVYGVEDSFGYISYKIVGKFQGLTLSYERVGSGRGKQVDVEYRVDLHRRRQV